MATNLAIDDKKINEALKIGGFKTKRETVNSALDFFIKNKRRPRILKLAGAIDFEATYDYKKERQRRLP